MTDLRELALRVGRQALGPEAIKDVRIAPIIDGSDRPAYDFTYLIDRTRTAVEPGRTSIELRIALLDALDDINDEHAPYVGILDQRDWDKTFRA